MTESGFRQQAQRLLEDYINGANEHGDVGFWNRDAGWIMEDFGAYVVMMAKEARKIITGERS